ncbi:hypothetical protein Leryth_023597 [Lithospermum erythrorhizon]|nr:hypothetical protein Leryth_023597 [Lithospermum erythrorhizon]
MDQVRGICGVKHEPLVKYHARAIQLAKTFEQIVFEHIPRAQNEEVDYLSRLATTYYEEAITLPVLEGPEYWRTPIAQYLVNGQLLEITSRLTKSRIAGFNFTCMMKSCTKIMG